jgi:hypothetical protein
VFLVLNAIAFSTRKSEVPFDAIHVAEGIFWTRWTISWLTRVRFSNGTGRPFSRLIEG